MRTLLRRAGAVWMLSLCGALASGEERLSPHPRDAVPRLSVSDEMPPRVKASFAGYNAAADAAEQEAKRKDVPPADAVRSDERVATAAAAARDEALDPAVPAAVREQLSSVMNRLGRAEDAARLSGRTLEDEPDNRDALNNRAAARYSLGEYRLAIADATRAMKVDPASEPAYTTRALAHYYSGEYLEAAEDARRALALDKNDETALATLRMAESRVPPAGAKLEGLEAEQARRVRDEYAAALDQRNEAEAEAAQAPPAALDRASEALNRQAAAKIALADHWGAVADATRAIERDGANAQAWALRASALNLAGRHEQAAADATRALQLAPGHALAYDTRAQALLALGRYDAAAEDATRSIALRPTNAYAFATRARAYEKLGDYPAMLADFQRAASLNPQFEPAYRRSAAEHALAPAAPAQASKPEKPVHPLWVVGGSSVIGGLLIAFGLLHIFSAPRRDPPRAPRLDERGEPLLLHPHFDVVRTIGRGGMGVVYEAVDKGLGRRVALKKMRDEIRLDPRERARFLEEARTIAALHHPCIVDIHAIVEEAGELCLVFEYVAGKTVEQLVAEKRRLPAPEARHLVRGVCRALDYAHKRGVVHQDLKPSNVMLSDEREVKVMDFGLARRAKDALRRTTGDAILGTPEYMAPEASRGEARAESDLYSLGVLVYEMLTGERPFRAPAELAKAARRYVPASRVVPSLPPELDALLDAALEPDPLRRIASAADFLGRFEAAFSSLR